MSSSLILPEKPRLFAGQPKKLLTRRGLIGAAGAAAVTPGLWAQARAQSPCGVFTPQVPAQASAAGFKNLVFADDFDQAGTIGPGTTGTGSGQFNWWLWSQCNATLGGSGSNVQVLTTTKASQVSNGNTGGGSNASPLGGILQLNGPQCNSGNITLTTAQNAWYGGYFEGYMQFNPNYNVVGNWNAFWMSALNRISYQGFPTVYMELDIIENYLGNYQYADNTANASCKEWGEQSNGGSLAGAGAYAFPNGSGGVTAFVQDSNWHTFGVLWVTTGPLGTTSSGYLEFYVDNQLSTFFNNGNTPISRFITGPNGTVGARYANFSLQQMYLGGSFGTGLNLNFDWVRIWQ